MSGFVEKREPQVVVGFPPQAQLNQRLRGMQPSRRAVSTNARKGRHDGHGHTRTRASLKEGWHKIIRILGGETSQLPQCFRETGFVERSAVDLLRFKLPLKL